uniref:Ribosomal protein S8 n=1 Tax=Chlorella heliozoae TaxID=554066 RepID=A0A2I4S6P0_9CHLO|nr:ribosomal protein S8 [Chlorella heliozoae]AST08722.1 ribosomal protein S8 [Chlorella heliozoae]
MTFFVIISFLKRKGKERKGLKKVRIRNKNKEFENMVNDTISDMLTRIRNANLSYKTTVSLSKTKVHEKICQILEQEGFIEKFYVSETQPNELVVDLKYHKIQSFGGGSQGKPCITNLKRISKPGLRIYTNSREIPKVLGGMGILILSTSKGLMTDRQARQARLGGEILCSVW